MADGKEYDTSMKPFEVKATLFSTGKTFDPRNQIRTDALEDIMKKDDMTKVQHHIKQLANIVRTLQVEIDMLHTTLTEIMGEK